MSSEEPNVNPLKVVFKFRGNGEVEKAKLDGMRPTGQITTNNKVLFRAGVTKLVESASTEVVQSTEEGVEKTTKVPGRIKIKTVKHEEAVSSPSQMAGSSESSKKRRFDAVNAGEEKLSALKRKKDELYMSPLTPNSVEKDFSAAQEGASATSSHTVRHPRKYVPLRKALNNALKKLIELDRYKFFYEPVREEDAPEYHKIIKNPMDFLKMRRKLNEDKYPYWNLFTADFELICQNCIEYNPPETIYWNEAKNLLLEGRKYLKRQGAKINPEQLLAPTSISGVTSNNNNAKVISTPQDEDGKKRHTNAANSHSASAEPTTVIFEKPKRYYIPNEELPESLLASPSPVRLLNLDQIERVYLTQLASCCSNLKNHTRTSEARRESPSSDQRVFSAENSTHSVNSSQKSLLDLDPSKVSLIVSECVSENLDPNALPTYISTHNLNFTPPPNSVLSDALCTPKPSSQQHSFYHLIRTMTPITLKRVQTLLDQLFDQKTPQTEHSPDILAHLPSIDSLVVSMESCLHIDLAFLKQIYSSESTLSLFVRILLSRNAEILALLAQQPPLPRASSTQPSPRPPNTVDDNNKLLHELASNLIQLLQLAPFPLLTKTSLERSSNVGNSQEEHQPVTSL
ncbi:bromodomain testis-specific protein-like [Schistocerca gregaria]|uniref:bromodomain testis-specific protein-like n=1 Tax=Schistocerca gregaria TaxID=7010 RepID=UPI00211F240E|nr:bromodomain testis-specific protein-like [Schistocerca gregaria]